MNTQVAFLLVWSTMLWAKKCYLFDFQRNNPSQIYIYTDKWLVSIKWSGWGEASSPFSSWFEHSVCTCLEKMPQKPMMTRMLKTADPTIVPTPTSPFVINTPKRAINHKKMWQCSIADGLNLSLMQAKWTKWRHNIREIAFLVYNHIVWTDGFYPT